MCKPFALFAHSLRPPRLNNTRIEYHYIMENEYYYSASNALMSSYYTNQLKNRAH